MKDIFEVRVTREGTIELPAELIAQNDIREGHKVTLIDLGDGVIVLNHRGAHLQSIADELAAELQNSGESLESMLAALREIRAEKSSKSRSKKKPGTEDHH